MNALSLVGSMLAAAVKVLRTAVKVLRTAVKVLLVAIPGGRILWTLIA
jgi:hypothetical protein